MALHVKVYLNGSNQLGVVNLSIISPQTNAQLNSLYPNSIPTFSVYCPNVSGGGLTYVYMGSGLWSSELLTHN